MVLSSSHVRFPVANEMPPFPGLQVVTGVVFKIKLRHIQAHYALFEHAISYDS